VVVPTNKQPKERVERGLLVDVVHAWKTIQGEGPFAGCPALFLRLAGCNLQCPACDTDYTSNRAKMEPYEVLRVLEGLAPPRLVVITGGEPFRQDLSPLITILVRAGFRVQIETNGTLFQELPFKDVTIVCSPKTASINPHLFPHIHSLKYVVEHGKVDLVDGLPLQVLGKPCRVARPMHGMALDRIYVQPLDEGDAERNKLHMAQALDSCQRFGYRLCLQIHKIVGVE